jgi:heme/copper-type cytochrome/quinol oxidase subunit 4
LCLLLDAAKIAALLGLLRRDSLQKTALEAVRNSIKKYTWTILRLMFLIGLTFIPFALVIYIVVNLLGAHKYVIIFGMGFYLVLIKYALAYPLVVTENLKAGDALWQSWEMTKGHFRYVLGCYLFLGLGLWLIRWTITSPVNDPGFGLSWAWMLVQFCLMLIELLWIVLSWCMYLRIKEMGTQPLSVFQETPTPPP